MKSDLLKMFIKPIHREGVRFVWISAIATFMLFVISPVLGLIGTAITAFVYFFFRDPARIVPVREGLMVSPADGLVTSIGPAAPPPELGLGGSGFTRVSVFLSIFDCHVNRTPVAGTVEKVAYKPGIFLNATLDKASEDNERNGLVIAMADGRRIGVVQIAGLIARRIVCFTRPGAELGTGDRFGLIRFGSRVDVYLPSEIQPMVIVGQRMIAGETVIADLASPEAARLGSAN